MSDSNIQSDSTVSLDRTEPMIAAPRPDGSQCLPLIAVPEPLSRAVNRTTQHKKAESKNLNLRLSPMRYDRFHQLKQRLRRATNEKTLDSMCAIVESYLDLMSRHHRPLQDIFELTLVENKRVCRASNRKVDLVELELSRLREHERKPQSLEEDMAPEPEFE